MTVSAARQVGVCEECGRQHGPVWANSAEAIERYLHPWKFPDPPIPLSVDLFPRTLRLVRSARAAAGEVRDRIRRAGEALRGVE